MPDRPAINPRTGKRWLRNAENFRVTPDIQPPLPPGHEPPNTDKLQTFKKPPRYTGGFPPDLVAAMIEAAEPIPPGMYTFTIPPIAIPRGRHPIITAERRVRCSRKAAIVRHLESIDSYLKAAANDLAPSALEIKLHAVAAAASTLSNLLPDGTGGNSASLSAQVENALWAMADEDGEPDPDARLREVIDAIAQLGRWSQKAERRARGRPESEASKDDLSAHVNLHNRRISGMDANPEEDATEHALAGVVFIWTKLLNRDFKTAVHNIQHQDYGIAYGPLVDFALACIRLLNLDPDHRLGEDAIRGRLRRMRDARCRILKIAERPSPDEVAGR